MVKKLGVYLTTTKMRSISDPRSHQCRESLLSHRTELRMLRMQFPGLGDVLRLLERLPCGLCMDSQIVCD